MIYETMSKTVEKMKVKPSWANELPDVVDRFGFNNESVIDTQIAIRTKGSMDDNLFIETVLFYKTLFPNLAPRPINQRSHFHQDKQWTQLKLQEQRSPQNLP